MDKKTELEQKFLAAYAAQREGKFKKAEKGYRKILKSKPDWGQVLGALGNLYLDQEKPDQARPLFEKAAGLNPPDLAACYSLGRMRQMGNDHKGAIPIYKRMLKQRPDSGLVWNNLGVAYRETGDPDKALESFQTAVKFAPEMAEAWNNLGVAQDEGRQPQEAMASYGKSIDIKPDYLSPHLNLGLALQKVEDFKGAEAHYTEVLKLQPENETARFMLQSIKGDKIPDAAPAEHVRNIFDQCADHFESILVKDLAYKTPELLFNLVRPHLTDHMAVLDLGCGTGLGAHLYKPFARSLTGVDLSPKMLSKADEKGLYNRLEIFDILQDWDFSEPFDLIYSSDVFVYFGELDKIFNSVSSFLVKGGRFAFSVEELSVPGDYKLFPSGRYAHSKEYIQDCLEKNGLDILGLKKADVRNQSGKPVKGLLATAVKV